MNKPIRDFLWALTVVMLLASPLWGEEFPGRAKYPTAQPISTEALHEDFKAGKVVIVDVRSIIEYDVIHPVGAIHVPISNMR
ncbi:MAG: rhodanese-like domain-containing protein, partial [Pseudomonadota bacterium]